MRKLITLLILAITTGCRDSLPSQTDTDFIEQEEKDIIQNDVAPDSDNWMVDNNAEVEPEIDTVYFEDSETTMDAEFDGIAEIDTDMPKEEELSESIVPENDTAQTEGNDFDTINEPDEPTGTDTPDEMPDSDGRYVIQGDAVIDNFRGLMWHKGNSAVMSQYDAITYCENLDVNGWLDWRLPTLSELRMIIEGCYYTSPPEFTFYCEANDSCLSQSCGSGTCYCGVDGPAEDNGFCEPGVWTTCGIQLWSASLVYDHEPFAWVVNFARAWVKEWNRYQATSQARCVRDL